MSGLVEGIFRSENLEGGFGRDGLYKGNTKECKETQTATDPTVPAKAV